MDTVYGSYCVAALRAAGIASAAMHNDLYVLTADVDDAVSLLTTRLGWSVDGGNLTKLDPAWTAPVVVRLHVVAVLPAMPEPRWVGKPSPFDPR